LNEEIAKLGLERIPSRGNFILIRVGDGQTVFNQLLKRGVIVRPMGAYNFPEYIRVTVGTAKENGRFINELNNIIKDQ
ncbi:MAG: aminotransferase class I/II-fold pyridoxal phosphate-dependent enzyme, partial [Candidatus Binatota bacterium]